MPSYEFHCGACGGGETLRRAFAAMDDPAMCRACGASMARQFTPNGAIHIPIHFKQWQTGGARGGGNIRFEDIHGVTSERELARTQPDLEPYNRVMSRSGVGTQKKSDPEPLMAEAFKEAKAKTDAIYN